LSYFSKHERSGLAGTRIEGVYLPDKDFVEGGEDFLESNNAYTLVNEITQKGI
jgi:hypothetical protein